MLQIGYVLWSKVFSQICKFIKSEFQFFLENLWLHKLSFLNFFPPTNVFEVAGSYVSLANSVITGANNQKFLIVL